MEFSKNDRIFIGEITGTVIHSDIQTTSVLQDGHQLPINYPTRDLSILEILEVWHLSTDKSGKNDVQMGFIFSNDFWAREKWEKMGATTLISVKTGINHPI